MCSKSNPLVVLVLDLMSTYEGEGIIDFHSEVCSEESES
jgi:hypothetical protein